MREKKQSLDEILEGFGPSKMESKECALMTVRVPRETKLGYDQAQAQSNQALSKVIRDVIIVTVQRALEKLDKAKAS